MILTIGFGGATRFSLSLHKKAFIREMVTSVSDGTIVFIVLVGICAKAHRTSLDVRLGVWHLDLG